VPDLTGGTGAIASRLAGVTLLDVDPVLLEVARAALGVPVVRADPGAPGWADGLPRFDAVVTGTAPRCFGPDRPGALCGEIRGLPRPGGAFADADRVPDRAATAPAARLAATDRAADPVVPAGRATDQDQGPEPGPDPADPPGAPPEAAPAAWRGWWRVALAHPGPAEPPEVASRALPPPSTCPPAGTPRRCAGPVPAPPRWCGGVATAPWWPPAADPAGRARCPPFRA